MPPARPAGPGFSPLDERLGLRPGSALTPWLVESIVRLGAAMTFPQVPALLAHFTGVTVSAATVRRLTEAAGAVAVALATEEVATLERSLPAPPPGPSVQQMSVDGAMVPLVGGVWAEVKTLAVGTVTAARTTDLSYFSRLADADSFGRLATVETHRRGITTAGTVVAVADGAVWCQGFVDVHRHDAVRILDFAHAVGHLGTVAQALFGPGTAAASAWLGEQASALRHGREAMVLAELAARVHAPDLRAETGQVLTQTHAYFAARLDQMRYQTFTAAGYPIGSGCVESANKLVVEARLKGAGMHWARTNVNPMLALRTLIANNRWAAAWPAIWARLRCPPHTPAPPPAPVASAGPVPSPVPRPLAADPPPRLRPPTIVNGNPTAHHPWRRSSPFRATR